MQIEKNKTNALVDFFADAAQDGRLEDMIAPALGRSTPIRERRSYNAAAIVSIGRNMVRLPAGKAWKP